MSNVSETTESAVEELGFAMGELEGEENTVEDDDEGSEEGEGSEELQPEGEEADPEEGEEDEEEGEEGEDPDLDKVFKIKVDGAEAEVTLKEMKEGYIRTETFHRRMNNLNEATNVVRAEATKVAARRDESLATYEELQKIMTSLVPAEPNWDEEFAKNPAQARVLQKQYQDFSASVKNIREQAAAEKAKRDQEAEERRVEEYRAEMAKIPQFFPEWKDEKVRTRDIQSMRRTAKAAGYSDEEIDSVLDPRQLKILQKAAQLDRMQARRAQPVEKSPSRVKANPGVGSSRTAPKGVSTAQKRLSKTGSVDDAGAVFASLLSRS